MAYGELGKKAIRGLGGASKTVKRKTIARKTGQMNHSGAKAYSSKNFGATGQEAKRGQVEYERLQKMAGDSAFNSLPKHFDEMAPKYQRSSYEHTLNTKFPKPQPAGPQQAPGRAKIGKRVAGDNHPSALQQNMDLALRNGYSPGMAAAKKAGGDHLDMLAGKFADSNARFGANGGWGGVGGAALRGAVVGGVGNGTFEAAQGGSFWDGAKSGAFYGATGTAGFRIAKQRTGAKTYFGKDGIKQTNARRNQAYGIMDGDKNTGAGVRALLGNQATAKMVSAANGLQR